MNIELSTRSVIYSIEEAIMTITLNREEKFNALGKGELKLLKQSLDLAAEDGSVRCVILRGSGKAFCSGIDIEEVSFNLSDEGSNFLERYFNPVLTTIMKMPKPVVVEVEGWVSGAGCGLALVSDFIVCSETSEFHFAYKDLGLVPNAGCAWLLPKLIGLSKSKQVLMSSGFMSAKEALDLGVVFELAPSQEVGAVSRQLAQNLSNSATLSLGECKRLISQSHLTSFEAYLESEQIAQTRLLKSMDIKAGVLSFLNNTKPTFIGGGSEISLWKNA